MVEEVIWTKKARDSFLQTILYLQQSWSNDIAEGFYEEVYDLIDKIVAHPRLGIKSDKYKNLRKVLIERHSFLLYRIKNYRLEIVDLFDTRRNPNKMKF